MSETITLDPLILPGDPSLHLALDSLTGVTDLSGNGYVGTAQGGVTVGGDTTLTNGGTDFDGSNDYISIGRGTAYRERLLAFGPTVYWPLDATYGVTDQSTGAQENGTAQGGITIGGASAPDVVTGDSSTDFDGVDDRITSSYAPFSAGGPARTICGWAYRDNASATHQLFSTGGANPVNFQLAPFTGDIIFDPDQSAAGGDLTWVAAWPGSSKWVFWALVVDQAGGPARLYLNGALVSEQTMTQNFGAAPGAIQFGAYPTASNPFDGKMAHLAIVEFVLTGDQIRELWDLGRWPFTNGHTRTFLGVARRDTAASADALISSDSTTPPALVLPAFNGNVDFYADNNGTPATWAAVWPTGEVVAWALVFREATNEAELFLNGVSQGVRSQSDPYATTPGNLKIGNRHAANADHFDGAMQHVMVYEYGLTGGEIGTISRALLGLRSELNISTLIAKDGVDWGDAQMSAYMAEQSVGSAPVDYRIPNRQISIPLVLKGTTFAADRSAVQTKIGQWQHRGGNIKRVLSDASGTVYADVVSAQLHLAGDWLQAHRDADVSAAITCEALPDLYEAEEMLSDHTETTLPEITFTESATNGGDFPLGDRVRVVIDEDQVQSQRGLMWAWRGRHYSSASTAASAYEAEALTILDTATRVAKGGASGGTVVTHGTISTSWTPVVGTNLTAGNYLTHTGTNRLYARVFSASGTLVQSRFVWDVGDLVLPSENDAVRLYDGGTFHVLDLGEMRLDPSPTGAHRWQGQIQAKGDVGGEAFSVDRVWIQNRDEAAGVLTAPVSFVVGGATYSARSEFNTESGVITGDALAVGGSWTVLTNSDTDDFWANAGVVTRTSVSDTGTLSPAVGRVVTPGSTNFAVVAASLDFKTSLDPRLGAGIGQGFFARIVDSANYLYAVVLHSTSGSALTFYPIVAGATVGQIYSKPLPTLAVDAYYTIQVFIDANGNALCQVLRQGGTAPLVGIGLNNSVLATGGALASGRIGMFDGNSSASAATRTYDNFAVWVPTPDAVVFASQSVELGTQGIIREDSGGAAYGPVSVQTGDIPRMPNRSSAGTVEFMGKLSRGDLATINDAGIDDISARVYRRASHLLIPG